MVPVLHSLYAGRRSRCKDGVSTLVSASFVPERNDRVEPGRPPRRVHPEDQAHGAGEEKGERDGGRREDDRPACQAADQERRPRRSRWISCSADTASSGLGAEIMITFTVPRNAAPITRRSAVPNGTITTSS